MTDLSSVADGKKKGALCCVKSENEIDKSLEHFLKYLPRVQLTKYLTKK